MSESASTDMYSTINPVSVHHVFTVSVIKEIAKYDFISFYLFNHFTLTQMPCWKKCFITKYKQSEVAPLFKDKTFDYDSQR